MFLLFIIFIKFIIKLLDCYFIIFNLKIWHWFLIHLFSYHQFQKRNLKHLKKNSEIWPFNYWNPRHKKIDTQKISMLFTKKKLNLYISLSTHLLLLNMLFLRHYFFFSKFNIFVLKSQFRQNMSFVIFVQQILS